MKTIYPGESLKIVFKARNPETGESINIQDKEITVYLYTRVNEKVTCEVERMSDSDFLVKLSSEETQKLKEGNLTVDITMSEGEDVIKVKQVIAQINSSVQGSGCCIPIDCNSIENVINMDCTEMVLTLAFGNEVTILGGDTAVIAGQWGYDKEQIANALTLQGVPTEPTEPGNVMAEKIRGLQLAVPGDPSFYKPTLEGYDPFQIMYNNQRAGYEAMYIITFSLNRTNDIPLTGADAYLTSDGQFYTANTVHEWSPLLTDRWVIHYFTSREFNLDIPDSYLYGNTVAVLKGKPVSVSCSSHMSELLIPAEVDAHDFISGSAIQTLSMLRRIVDMTLSTVSGGTVAYACSSLAQLTLPELSTVSGGTVAYNCSSLAQLTLPELEEINAIADVSVVRLCSSIKELDVSSLKRIYVSSTFGQRSIANNCGALHTIIFRDLEEISGYAIIAQSCPVLKRVFLPATEGGGITGIHMFSQSSIEDIELGEGFLKPINFASWTTAKDRATIREHIIDRLGTSTEPVTITFNTATYNMLTAEDIQAIEQKNWTIVVS